MPLPCFCFNKSISCNILIKLILSESIIAEYNSSVVNAPFEDTTTAPLANEANNEPLRSEAPSGKGR